MTEVAGPRRYRVQFEINVDRVGDLIGLLVKDVTALHSQPATADAQRISFGCLYDQLSTIVSLVVSGNVDRLIVRPDDEESKSFARGTDNRPVEVGHVVVKRIPPSHPKLRSGGHVREEANPYRRVVMGMFTAEKMVVHFIDVADAFSEANLSAVNASNVLARMTKEGELIRIHRGAYRLPTTEETAALLHRRAEQVRGNQSPNHSD